MGSCETVTWKFKFGQIFTATSLSEKGWSRAISFENKKEKAEPARRGISLILSGRGLFKSGSQVLSQASVDVDVEPFSTRHDRRFPRLGARLYAIVNF